MTGCYLARDSQRSQRFGVARELHDYFAPVRAEAVKKGYTEAEIDTTIDQAVVAVRARGR